MSTERDRFVMQLRARGVPLDVAEREAARRYGGDTRVVRRENVLEKTEQLEVRKRFSVCGFKAYNLSQPRATKQTPGLPDLWCVHRELPLALWWETKRQIGGRFSDAQLEFAAECARCRVGYGCGDRYDAERYLIDLGRARYDEHGAFVPLPPQR